MGPGSRRTAVALAAIAPFTACSAPDDASSLRTDLRGRVEGNLDGDAVPLAGVRVVAWDPDTAGDDPEFHAAEPGEPVLAEAITDADGRYRLDLPRGWVSVAFDHEAWLTAYRTEDTTFDRALELDVALTPAPAPRAFAMPQAGEAEVVLAFAGNDGRAYARLHVEPGDLVLADGSAVVGTVEARVDAPDPSGLAADALWASNRIASPRGVEPLAPFGLVSVELSSGGADVQVARGATLVWEIVVAPTQLDAARDAWRDGLLHNYSLDTRSGLWVRDPAQIDFVDDTLVVERTHFSAGAVGGTSPPQGSPCGTGSGETIIGLDGVDIGGTPVIVSGSASASVGSNGNIAVRGRAIVQGTASSSAGTVTRTGQARITGGAFTGVPTFVAPVPEAHFAAVRAANDNAAISGALSANGSLSLSASQSVVVPAGDYALTSIDLTGQSRLRCSGTVRLYVGGTVKIAGQARVNDDRGCNLVIVSDAASSVSFAGGAKVSAAVYAPRASISFAGNALSLSGAVVGRTVSVTGTFDFLASDDAFTASRACEPLVPPGGSDDGEGGDDDGGTTGDPDEDDDADTDLPPIPDLPD